MCPLIEIDSSGKPIAYAWPGGYPVFYLVLDAWRNEDGSLELNKYDKCNHTCCPTCAGDADNNIVVVTYDVNYVDNDLYCEYCGKQIESAYGEENYACGERY